MTPAIPLRPSAVMRTSGVGARRWAAITSGSSTSVREAVRIVHAAIDAGITFMDNAWEYHDGESEIRMGKAHRGSARAGLPDDQGLHARPRRAGGDAAARTSRCGGCKTDYLDLWQVHECVYYNDPERHFARGGVIEALDRAKQQGKVRYVGFTGHKDPEIHLRMLSHGYPFDSLPAAAERASTPRSGASSSACCPSCSASGSRRSA